MSDRKVVKPIVLAVGAALAGSFALGSSIASAETVESPFAMSTLSAGYLLGTGEGSCGGDKEGKEGKEKTEGSCGGDKEGESHDKDGEGSCGGEKEGESHDKDSEGSCGGDKEGESADKDAEGSCGEGSCGGDATDS